MSTAASQQSHHWLGINPEFGKPATAVYKLAKPLVLKPGVFLEFSIAQTYGGGRTIGRPPLGNGR